MIIFFKFCIILCISLSSGASSEDEIQHLPGLNHIINFKHYSGYLNGTSGDFLHYWFVESEKNPKSDPLILWFNGGPGCSSLDGLLNELGPYHIFKDGKSLFMNPFSWNKIANVLFIESPVCVGFSYRIDGSCNSGDDSTSLSNYNALKSFYKKFPEFRKNDLYVTGESYGGIYIPTLSMRILQGQNSFPINFIGYAIGNGLSSYELNDKSLIFFGYYHGLFGPKLWEELVDSCCQHGIPSQSNCQFDSVSSRCSYAVKTAQKIIFNNDLNMYNLYGKCLHPQNKNQTHRYHFDRQNLFYKMRARNQTGHLLSPRHMMNALKLDPPCTDSTSMRAYLNDPEVRKSLHISDHAKPWDICSDDVNENYKRRYSTMKKQYNYLTKRVKGLIYNGDVDMACNFLGDEWFSETLGLRTLNERSMWYYEDQIAGFYKRFHNLDVVTIRGAGHMVPQDKPGPAFKMIKAFINDKDY